MLWNGSCIEKQAWKGRKTQKESLLQMDSDDLNPI